VERISKMGGKSTRIGVYKCYQCRKPFRVTVKTMFEASHVPLRLWLQAVHLMASSKEGHQREPAPSHAWRYVENGVVYGSPHS
jgi:transposase-like protein